MGMPHKRSRKVTHEGHVYWWRIRDVSESKRYCETSPLALVLTIQRDDPEPGRVCQATLRSKRAPPDLENYGHRVSLYPRDVKEVIGQALARGWGPAERGAAFGVGDGLDLTDYYTDYYTKA